MQGDAALCRDGVAQRRGQRIDQAAFDPACRHQALARTLVALALEVGEVGHHRLQGLAAKALQEVRAPGAVRGALSTLAIRAGRSTRGLKALEIGAADVEATVRRQQVGDLDPGRTQHRYPGAIRAQPGPAAAAQREQHRVGVDPALTVRGGEAQLVLRRRRVAWRTAVVPAQPAMAHLEAHARCTQAREPGAQQWRRLHFLGEYAARAADEGVHPQAMRPVLQRLRAKDVQHGCKPCALRAVARQEGLQGFTVGQIEPAAPGEQELAPDRRHGVVHRHRGPRRGQLLCRHQARRSAADDGDAHGGRAGRQLGDRGHAALTQSGVGESAAKRRRKPAGTGALRRAP